jgi:hypothetical protein
MGGTGSFVSAQEDVASRDDGAAGGAAPSGAGSAFEQDLANTMVYEGEPPCVLAGC